MESYYSCLNPTKLFDDLGRSRYVNCGKCAYCLNLRRLSLNDRVRREILKNTGTGTMIFVTFTYNNSSLPVYTLRNDGYWHSNREHILHTRIENRGIKRYEKRIKETKYTTLDKGSVSAYYKPARYRNKYCFAHLCLEDVSRSFSLSRSRLKYDYFDKVAPFKNETFGNCSPNTTSLGILKDIPALVGKRLKDILEQEGLEYDDLRYRYFMCGEYGPTTFRPHYHAILFFRKKLGRLSRAYIYQNLLKVWTYGDVDIQEVVTGGIESYLSNYVTGFFGLPEVLRAKPVRPFCTFSKVDSIGSWDFDKDKVLEQILTSDTSYTEFDPHTSEFRTSPLPLSYMCRFFPKCKGFSKYGCSEYDNEKRRVFSYVYRLFKEQGITHTPEEVLKLRVRDIPFELYDECKEIEYTDTDVCFPYGYKEYFKACKAYDDFLEGRFSLPSYYYYNTKSYKWSNERIASWLDEYKSLILIRKDCSIQTKEVVKKAFVNPIASYADRYCSLVVYRYCVLYNLRPDDVLQSFESIYQKRSLDKLGKYYAGMESEDVATVRYSILNDRDFVDTLPVLLDDLEDWQYYALESYGFDVEELYSSGCLDSGFVTTYSIENDPAYFRHVDKCVESCSRGIKRKKLNEFKNKINASMHFVSVGDDYRYIKHIK
uniref:Replication initiator protein n=1 Tax=Dulem virus 259 TaxID=3145736 RepID=A0AAU8BAB6_9VIRU